MIGTVRPLAQAVLLVAQATPLVWPLPEMKMFRRQDSADKILPTDLELPWLT
jgi:hypothetical protein